MSNIQRLHVSQRFSEIAVHQGVVYLAGQVPNDGVQGIEAQTKDVLQSVDRFLADAGTDKSQILMATVYLADMSDYDAMNAVWDQWVASIKAPPRACVEAKLAVADWTVEVVLTAALV